MSKVDKNYINLKQNQNLYQHITHQGPMNKIKAKIKQLTVANTKSSYEKSIEYLLRIIETLMVRPSHCITNIQTKRSLSEERSKIGKQIQVNGLNLDDSDSSEEFKGSQISYIQRLKRRAHEEMKEQQYKKQGKINLRQFQQSIEIYHQCLLKSMQMIGLQHKKLCKISSQSTDALEKLKQFCNRYVEQKKNCKNFKELTCMCRQILSKEFLSALHPMRKPLSRGRPEAKQTRYLVVYE